MMSGTNSKSWPCSKCGWLLGRVEKKSNRSNHLHVFEQSQAPGLAASSFDIDLLAVRVVVMGAAEVFCSNCEQANNWHPTQRTLDALVRGQSLKRGVK